MTVGARSERAGHDYDPLGRATSRRRRRSGRWSGPLGRVTSRRQRRSVRWSFVYLGRVVGRGGVIARIL